MTPSSALPSAERPLLERDAELAALEALIEAAAHGDGRLVIVQGSAGIGKTRLLTVARTFAAGAGFRVLMARAGELESAFPFGIVRQLFEPALARAGADDRLELMTGAAELATPLFAPNAGFEAPYPPAEPSFSILHGLYWVAANLALRQPTLLAIDDLHWADEPSLSWIAYLARRLDGLPLIVVAATRPPEQATVPGPVTELITDPLATVIRPSGLGSEATAILSSERLGTHPDDEFVEALQRATGGNPLYLTALLDSVAAEHIDPSSGEAERVLAVGPQVVSRQVEQRLAQLAPQARALVECAAALGGETPLEHAAALAKLDLVDAASTASALVRFEFLRSENPIEFRHPVVRSSIYETIPLGLRSTMHRRAAELLLGRGSRPEKASGHLLATFPAGDSFVSDTLRAAARRALEHGAATPAVNLLRRALDEPPADDELFAVLVELGSAEQLVSGTDAVKHLATAFGLPADQGSHAALAIRYSRALWLVERFEEAVRVVHDSLDELDSAAPPLREELTAELIGASWADERFYDLAVTRLAEIDEAGLVGGVGTDRLLALLSDFEVRRGRDRQRAVALAERSLESGTLIRERDLGFFSVSAVFIVAGDLERVGSMLDGTLLEARRHGDAVSAAKLVTLRSLVELLRGNLAAAESDVDEGLELSSLLTIESTRFACTARSVRIALERGDTDAAADLVATLERTKPQPTAPQEILLRDARGRLALLQRHPDAALADFLACGLAARSAGIENPAYIPWRSQAALALRALGRLEEARDHASIELELAKIWGEPRAIGAALLALGLSAEAEEGIDLLRAATEATAQSQFHLEHARTLIELGAALRRFNKRSEARQNLLEGLDLAHVCGAAPLVLRANDELAATGAHRRTVLYTGVEALTASERRVAQMAAEDTSNKDIAQALFVTVKTVEMHLSRVYRKLGLSSRTQLADALSQPALKHP